MNLYEILVPTVRNDGRPISARCHRVWDSKVISITGGMTIMGVAKGTWVSPSGSNFKERMIPVRIMCDSNQIEEIIQLTIDYYEQEAVLAYVISQETLLRFAKPKNNGNPKYPTYDDLKDLRADWGLHDKMTKEYNMHR